MLRSQHFKGEANVRRSTSEPCVTALVLLAGTLILALSRVAGATRINASSASESDVAAAIASAANGDIVIIPGGTITWTRTLRVRKGITIQGAGVGVTIIKDAVQSGKLVQWSLAPGFTSRLTGIEFQDGGRTTAINAPRGILHVDGSNTNGSTFRMDHCKWNGNLNGPLVFDTVIGVIDHNQFILSRYPQLIYPYHTRWNGIPGDIYGDGSWAAPTGYGSSQWLFIEDNDFHDDLTGYPRNIVDGLAGTRLVIRHNTIFNCAIANHGTESGGRYRGCRAMDIYQNTFTGTNIGRDVGGSRSGGVLFHDNNISGWMGSQAEYTLQNYRNFFPFSPWGGADGTNPWDVNDPTVFFTGTAAANSSGTIVTVSGVNWSTNQWKGYTLRRTSKFCNPGSLNFGWIRSNTSNTITYTGNGNYPGPTNMSFCAGDSLEIRKVIRALDQDGSAGGSLITGNPPVQPPGWNNQVTEPLYSWNNPNDVGGQVNFVGVTAVTAGIYYFNNTPMPGYTPYVYPHPLVTGNPPGRPSSSPAATRTSLRRPWGGKKQKETKRVRKPPRKAKENPINEMADGRENPGD